MDVVRFLSGWGWSARAGLPWYASFFVCLGVLENGTGLSTWLGWLLALGLLGTL